jgi:hypothetical protein
MEKIGKNDYLKAARHASIGHAKNLQTLGLPFDEASRLVVRAREPRACPQRLVLG